MLDTLRMLLADSLPTAGELDPPIHPGDLRVAACALLLQVAHADGHFSREERAVISRTLVTYFGLDERGALELMAEAERQLATATDDASFTRQLIRVRQRAAPHARRLLLGRRPRRRVGGSARGIRRGEVGGMAGGRRRERDCGSLNAGA